VEWMAGEVFARNPIGVLVDFSDIRRRLELGEPFESIMRRPDEAPA